MEVFKRTVANVFAGERRYLIPLFQRPYVWTREGQWEPLWEDIRERAESELVNVKTDVAPHFMGAIVVQQRATFGDELLAHDVIDGQQRLTTFQLLLTALADVARARDEKQVAVWAESLCRNANAMSNPDVEQFKVWPTSRDTEQFRFVTTAGSCASVEARHPPVYRRRRLASRPRMVEAYVYFHEALSAWLVEGGEAMASERARAIRRVFDKRLQIVSIELEGQEDPQAIFETLNARGVPLLASDLLRNYIFQRAGGPQDAERLHAKYWVQFEVPEDDRVPDGQRLWEVEVRQGRLSRARLDLFVQHYLSMKRGADVSSGHLFQEYKAWIETKRPFSSVDEELREFAKCAEQFRLLIQPSASTSTGRFAEKLRVLDTSTVYPLVLGLLGYGTWNDAERDRAFRVLESFLVRRLVCGRPTKNYNRLFIQVLRDLEQAPGGASAAKFHQLLAAGQGENVDWPDDAAFEKGWSTVDAYNGLKSARVEMILRTIEETIRPAKAEEVSLHGRLTVEHVMPQEWRKNWVLPAGDNSEAASESRDMQVHDFGNLTLLTQALNSTVSNGSAKDKLPAIAAQSLLSLNRRFSNLETWTEADIAKRRGELFAVARKAWPGPNV